MKKIYLLSSAIALMFATTSCADSTLTTSPDGALSTTVGNEAGSLTVAMSYDKAPIMNATPLQLAIDGESVAWQITGSTSCKKSDTTNMITGEFGKVEVTFSESEYKLSGTTPSGKSVDGSLFVRSYDKAMAYRFILNKSGKYTIVETSPYLFADNNGGYMTPNGEHEPLGPSTPAEVGESSLFTPAVYDSGEGYFLALHESDLHNYPQLRLTEDQANNAIKVNNLEAVVEGCFELPWRIVMYGETIADLHNTKSIYQSFNEPAEGDFSWVKPGISLWDFRVLGMTFDGFTYEMNYESLKRYVDFAARRGLEYLLIDAGWYDYNGDPLTPKPEVRIQELINYATTIDVGILLYYDLGYMRSGTPKVDFETIASTYSSWGAKGMKYGFLGTAGERYTPQEKVRMTEEVIAIAAKHKLMVDFHDQPVPFSGLERTYPNYVNREYCHAQLDRRTAFYPNAFVKTICANMLAGQMDQTNGTFEIYGMERRSKGPGNPYYSTVAAEAARVFMSHTGHLTVLIDSPDAYDRKSDLFQFIADLPARWDEVRYLDMQFESYVSIARRKGNNWFAATVFDDDGGNSEMKLCFLDPARKYKATIYRDAADTHYKDNPESYEIESREVTSTDTIKVKVAPGGGFGVSFKAL